MRQTKVAMRVAEYIAPGADANASGSAVVLEAARLLSHYKPAYSVLYAFWDQEELGRLGSSIYAKDAQARGERILGVINLDGHSTLEVTEGYTTATTAAIRADVAKLQLPAAESADEPTEAQRNS